MLAVLAAVLAMVFPAGTASASGLPVTQTRVGLSQPVSADIVGVHAYITAGQRPVRGPSQLQVVSGNCVAAETASSIPEESQLVMRGIQRDGVVVESGVHGPSVPEEFLNDGRNGGSLLPRVDGSGNPITYREWGTVPRAGNPKPGGERIVSGSDGSFYYSPDHYQNFVPWVP